MNPMQSIPPDEALTRLRIGNARYVSDAPALRDYTVTRAALEHVQNPFAAVLGCADSRVSPELAFDQGPGDLFVVRLAGNLVSTEGVASMEYAVRFLGVSLIVVLGHNNCGAVQAAIKVVRQGVRLPGRLPELVEHITPQVHAELAAGDGHDELPDAVIKRNVRQGVSILRNCQPVLAPQVASGALQIVGAVKDLASGIIRFLDQEYSRENER